MGGDEQNTQGVPDHNPEADTASGGAPDEPDTSSDQGTGGAAGATEKPETTDENDRPVENPSG